MRGGAMVNEVVVAVPRLVSARGDLHHALRLTPLPNKLRADPYERHCDGQRLPSLGRSPQNKPHRHHFRLLEAVPLEKPMSPIVQAIGEQRDS